MGDGRVKLALCFDRCLKQNPNDGQLFYDGGMVKVTFFQRNDSLDQLKAHLTHLMQYGPDLSSQFSMVDVRDNSDVACMLERPSPIDMYIQRQSNDLSRNRPSTISNETSKRVRRSGESVGGELAHNEGVIIGLGNEFETKKEHDIQ
ncbi:hypothetical protein AMTR_s00126p00125800 [Amborella trichopoda]|uniref:PB1 domain-containing protein n=1 Tax=Amborella trichopoda TaxID=13333 RepID=W1NQS2_AMBTC|nr:hypothetical protein AMTR_s00126p00125800 [Amborella trichopoda]